MFNKEYLYQQLQRLAKHQLDHKRYPNNGNIEIKDVNGKCLLQIHEAVFDKWLDDALKTLCELDDNKLSEEMVKLAVALRNYI